MALSITCNQKFKNLLLGLCNFEIFILAVFACAALFDKKINIDDIIKHFLEEGRLMVQEIVLFSQVFH